ncbi:MAG: spermidine synthase [Thermobacillus sp. ZCTH02-B1]|uniref:spermidine synthase n=1 Tax=Thermobacillus sp. ZCTH02-B1 TaxID=1858795 RepID=UPI000B55AD41|nr:fused MFS/spermidine synthase [Thermobacillus sp. ZCTH02-B1]OUM95360.1 MAG: spermidine synthase [Thermobacillus sp. ZCTH02-B1]
MHVIAREKTPWNDITVYETGALFGMTGRFRCLQFADGAVQGAIDLKDPGRVVLEYPRAILHLLGRNAPGFERAFMIGHGIGTIPSQYPARTFTVAEIDGRVAAISREYFGYPWDNIAIGDGRALLEAEPPASLDAVLIDAFTKDGTPVHLTTLECFEAAAARMRGPGLLILNLTGRARGDRRIASVHAALALAFRHTAAFFLPASPGRGYGNVLLAAGGRPIAFAPEGMAGFRPFVPEPGYAMRDRA